MNSLVFVFSAQMIEFLVSLPLDSLPKCVSKTERSIKNSFQKPRKLSFLWDRNLTCILWWFFFLIHLTEISQWVLCREDPEPPQCARWNSFLGSLFSKSWSQFSWSSEKIFLPVTLSCSDHLLSKIQKTITKKLTTIHTHLDSVISVLPSCHPLFFQNL